MNSNIIVKMLKKIADKLTMKEDVVFCYPVDKQKKYLQQFKEPSNYIERSYYQYCCQQKTRSNVVKICLNIFAYPLIVYFLLKYRCVKIDIHREKGKAVFLADGKSSGIVPNSLKEKYANIQIVNEYAYQLSRSDKQYVCELMRLYPLSAIFILKNLIKIARYRDIAQKYNPSAFIVCAEYSFTSSVLTEWCERNQHKHINVMHGEKAFYMGDAFFEYHECYVWHKHYEQLFLSLRASDKQFIIEQPAALFFENKDVVKKEYDYVYYLTDENEEVLKRISEIMNRLSKKGYKVAVRFHPRYSKKELVESIIGKVCEIENPTDVSIEISVLRTRNVISLISTVLTQAIYNGIPIVVDDLSNPQRYSKLEELEFFFLKYESRKVLSEIL